MSAETFNAAQMFAASLGDVHSGGVRPQIGADVLDDVERFLGRFVAYPSEHARVAHVLWIAHTHLMDAWESTPRIAFLSPEPGSGKSRALEVTELLVPRPVHAVNTTPAYLFRKVSDEAGPPTVLYDEIDTVFGPKAKDNEDIRGMLNAGHRRGAMAGRCVVRGKIVETEELPAYCAVALAGLHDLPDTILSRSIVVRMRRRAPTERVEPFRHRVHRGKGHDLRDRLQEWAADLTGRLGDWPEMPEGIEDRDADVWEPLLMVAHAAGADWPERTRVAAVSLVTASKAGSPSLGVLLLTDIKRIFDSTKYRDRDHIITAALVDELCSMVESPWGDLKGKPLNARGLARRLRPYDVAHKVLRTDDGTFRGYERGDFYDGWLRYVPESLPEHVTSETPKQDPLVGVPATDDVTSETTRMMRVDRYGVTAGDAPAGSTCVTCSAPVQPSRRAIETGWPTFCKPCGEVAS